MNYVNNKNKIYKVVFSLISFILMLSGVSYAYFSTQVKDNETNSTLTAVAANLILEFKEGSNQINGDGIFPGWSATKTFTVNNKNKIDAYYNLYIDEIKNELMSESISYKIESTDGGYNGDKVLLPKEDGIIKTGIYIKANTTHTYKVTAYYNNLDIDQSSEKGKTFSFKIYIKAYSTGEQTNISQNGGTIVLKNSLESDLSNYKIYGNTKISGTPTPGSPVNIIFLGNNTSKNLFNPDNLEQGAIFDATGNLSNDDKTRVRTINPITLEKGTYYMSLKNCDNVIIRAMYKYNLDNTFIQYNSIGSKFFDFTLSEDTNVKFSFINNNQEIVPEDLKFCQIQLEKGTSATSYEEYKGINLEIYKNLIENGYGEAGNNTNFSKFTYKTDTPLSSINGSFYVEGTEKTIEYSDERIKIDPTKKYNYSVYVKNEGDAESKYYVGIIEDDVDKKFIFSQYVMYVPNTLTKLKQDLKAGDTVVYLEDVSNFIKPTNTSQDAFIIWNYCDSTGYCYEPETYSRNYKSHRYTFDGIDKLNNTITLINAWDSETIKAGIYLSQGDGDVYYNYSLGMNISFPSSWKKLSSSINGLNSFAFVTNSHFRHGTYYIRPFAWNNYSGTSTNAKTYYAGFRFVEDGYEKQTTIKLNEPLRCVNNICDYIDYETKKVVRKIGKKVFTGGETWYLDVKNNKISNSYEFYSTDDSDFLKTDIKNTINTHFTNAKEVNGSEFGSRYNMIISSSYNVTTATEFKAWLKTEYENGTPVTVYYVKETETKEDINLKPITSYNDTTSISVSDENNISPSKIEASYKKNK